MSRNYTGFLVSNFLILNREGVVRGFAGTLQKRIQIYRGRQTMQNPTEPKWSLRLPADCSIAAIRSVYDLIRDAFGRQHALEIDCSRVAKADVTSIQLLLSTAKTGQAQGRAVVLTELSQNFRNTLRRAGFLGEAITDDPFNDRKDGA